ncbi:DUF3459 domain-containing protein [Segetibacter sp. 3557_3]|uniref:alpha-amylase family glycosyl hydrolase n=1 Tax=Segetibacter sp. 3557_3 TaxID=2547429 RepID=UPI0010587BFF|nr:alpha-amylase family glycosyl hydrolase [Segetibacter sp. 3557_3]TDH26507.1 DUF3459 domain-containing protein [Segetibacter sp. 3557_3]
MDEKFIPVDWAAGANIYEVNLRQYTTEGTFEAFAKELPRLKHMGVHILWFMPITPISVKQRQGSLGSYYACSSYTQTNPEFGGIEQFKLLVQGAHDLGMKVIIDWVANHTGWDHEWTQAKPHFYKKNDLGEFYDSNGWKDVIDLDYNNPEMREALLSAMRFWVEETGIDGFRCDMAHLVPIDFWRSARLSLDNTKKLFWLAETEEQAYFQVFDAVYAWQFLHTMEAYWKKEINMHGLEDALKPDAGHHGVKAFFTSNHDENSHSGSEYERLGDAAKPFAVLCATWQNAIPLVYSGQELPNKRRLAFFEKDPIQWTGTNTLEQFYRALLTLKREHPAMQNGDPGITLTRLYASSANIFAFKRSKGDREVVVILNLSASGRQRFLLPEASLSGTYTGAFSGIPYYFDENVSFELQAWDYLVYYK